ncbi:hypothetical protein L1887_26147 [Cichorium endivia]|nr:hypothetical protein L1887_26147 [Cichorium endivia]
MRGLVGALNGLNSSTMIAQVVSDPSLTKSSVYWSWNKEWASFENQLSEEESDVSKARKLPEKNQNWGFAQVLSG